MRRKHPGSRGKRRDAALLGNPAAHGNCAIQQRHSAASARATVRGLGPCRALPWPAHRSPGGDGVSPARIAFLSPLIGQFGFPPDPKTLMPAATAYEKGHIAMKPSDFAAQRDAVSRLRKSELWRVRATVG